jgi:hypothetical protein
MFNGAKYTTKGIAESVSPELISKMYQLIEDLRKKKKLDYLQIFRLTTKRGNDSSMIQVIEHEQEVPPFKRKYEFNVVKPITEKIYVIDNSNEVVGSYCTMLFAHEY